jgi:prepilin-type N-terminal cleavage/methylation domain-containing protein
MLYSKSKSAFTLVELLVVLVIVSLIVAVLAPKGSRLLNSVNQKIKQKEDFTQLKLISYKSFLSEINITKDNMTINKFGLIYDTKKKL